MPDENDVAEVCGHCERRVDVWHIELTRGICLRCLMTRDVDDVLDELGDAALVVPDALRDSVREYARPKPPPPSPLRRRRVR